MQEWRKLILGKCLLHVPAARSRYYSEDGEKRLPRDLDASHLIDQAVRNPHGGDRSKVYNVQLEIPKGNSRDRALHRLRDQRPDLHALVIADKLSAHRAMIEAGFRTLWSSSLPAFDVPCSSAAARLLDDVFC
jgi:hypothetical protein